VISCVCSLPKWRWVGRKFLCQTCNTWWVVERYIKWRVWTTVRTNGKKERR